MTTSEPATRKPVTLRGTPAALWPRRWGGETLPMEPRVAKTQIDLRCRIVPGCGESNVLVMSPGDFAELLVALRNRDVPTIDPALQPYYRAATGGTPDYIQYNSDIVTWSSKVKPGSVVLCGPCVPTIDPEGPQA